MIHVRDEGSVRVLRLDRPEARNALDPATIAELTRHLREADTATGVRCIVLAAEGPVFCSGGDVEVMRQHGGDARQTLLRLRSGLNGLVRLLHHMRCPVVCAMRGDAYGAGALLAFQCDLTVVASEAKVALSFRHVGLVPDSGGTWLLPRILGLQRAKHLVWTGTPFSGEDAVSWGLALRAVPRSQVDDEALMLARVLADGPAATTALAKRALEAGAQGGLDDALEREARIQAQAALTPEHEEGRDAFFQKRPPHWP